MPTTFVTAAQAEKQVTSHQARLSHAHTFGEGRYLLDGLKLTMETPNRLKAGAGVMLVDGSYVTVDEAGQEWTIENGAQAMKRIDLAGYEYSVGEDGMESLAPKVLKGVPHATAPTMPTYAKGSLLDRPAKLFVPVAKVELDGISAKQPTCMLDDLPTVAELRDSVSRAYSREEQETERLWLDGKRIYERTVDFGEMTTGETRKSLGFAYDTMVDYVFRSASLVLPAYPNDEYWRVDATVNSSEVVFRVGASIGWANPVGTFRYTK